MINRLIEIVTKPVQVLRLIRLEARDIQDQWVEDNRNMFWEEHHG